VIRRIRRADAIDLLPTDQGVDLAELRSRGEALRKRLRMLVVEFADDPDTSPDEYREMRQAVRDKLTAVESDLADAGRSNALAPLVTADDVDAYWTALSTDKRRAVIEELMEIKLHSVGKGRRAFRDYCDEIVKITWKTPSGASAAVA
jgi:hypothetical protein